MNLASFDYDNNTYLRKYWAYTPIMLAAKDIMSTHLVQVRPDLAIADAAEKMNTHDVGSLIVVENNMPVGIVTETDFTRRVVAENTPRTHPIRNIMSSPLYHCDPEADLMQVAHTMRTNHIKKLLVISGERLRGVITQTDVVRHVVSSVQDLAHQYSQGSLSGDQYAQQAAELFHTFHHSLDEVSKNWHMKCDSCGYKFLAAEQDGVLSINECPSCHSSHIAYDKNPNI